MPDSRSSAAGGLPLRGGQLLIDILPEPEILGDNRPGVIIHGHSGDFPDTGFDSIHQPEIGDYPGEGPPLLMAASLKIERCGGKIGKEVNAPNRSCAPWSPPPTSEKIAQDGHVQTKIPMVTLAQAPPSPSRKITA